MSKYPVRWSDEELANDAIKSAAQFRAERLAISDSWETHYTEARGKFELLLSTLGDLRANAITDETLATAWGNGLGEALRYLAGPPISDDDLQVIANVESLAPGVLRRDVEASRRVFEVISRVIDAHRFPWIRDGGAPSPQQRESALLASSVLLAAQRIATERRNDGKTGQETKVKDFLKSLGFEEVPPVRINTALQGPGTKQFCAECHLQDRKADVVVRLPDTRLLAIECKVSNSATNSVKRLNNDAAVKAEYWLHQFGISHVVPAAAVAGVFKLRNLQQAQERGLAIFWTHSLDKLGTFIASTGQPK